MTIRIIYHSVDFDGIGSAALIYHHLKNQNTDIILYPFNYYNPESLDVDSWYSNDTVYVLDVSFRPFDYMLKLYNKHQNNLIYCDHHTSSLEEVQDNDLSLSGVQDKNLATIQCVFKYIYPDKIFPKAIALKFFNLEWKTLTNTLL